MIDITASRFTSRFVTLVLKGNGIPRKELDRHVLLLSAALSLDPATEYSEPQLNDALKVWSGKYGDNVCFDHVTLRRFLVDEHYLVRDAAGKLYRVIKEGLPVTFEESIRSLDLDQLIVDFQDKQERRRKAHQQSAD